MAIVRRGGRKGKGKKGTHSCSELPNRTTDDSEELLPSFEIRFEGTDLAGRLESAGRDHMEGTRQRTEKGKVLWITELELVVSTYRSSCLVWQTTLMRSRDLPIIVTLAKKEEV